MTKCPYCHFDNEDGALFCEQCKSDLAVSVPVVAAEVAIAQVVEAIPVVGHADVPMAAIVESAPVLAESSAVSFAEAIPVVTPTEQVTPSITPAEFDSSPVTPVTPIPVVSATPAVPVGPALAETAQARLLVLRGLKRNVEYPIYEGMNYIGRADEKPVDIDLEDQEPPDRIWSSRQHAVIGLEKGQLTLEDLSSSNGTFVNRTRIHPGQIQPLKVNDVIQIGTVQLKVIM